MDTSETYVKQCEKAEEIQELSFEKYSFSVYTYGDGYSSLCINLNDRRRKRTEFEIWLPCQDQLQEMVWKPEETINHLFVRFWDFVVKDSACNSFEQLWLVFVMKEKYNKTWNLKKEEWEEKNDSKKTD